MDQTNVRPPHENIIDDFILPKLHADVDYLLSACGLTKTASMPSGADSSKWYTLRVDPAQEAAYMDFADKPNIYGATNRKPSDVVPAKPASHP
jgi:hypothetical protein